MGSLGVGHDLAAEQQETEFRVNFQKLVDVVKWHPRLIVSYQFLQKAAKVYLLGKRKKREEGQKGDEHEASDYDIKKPNHFNIVGENDSGGERVRLWTLVKSD